MMKGMEASQGGSFYEGCEGGARVRLERHPEQTVLLRRMRACALVDSVSFGLRSTRHGQAGGAGSYGPSRYPLPHPRFPTCALDSSGRWYTREKMDGMSGGSRGTHNRQRFHFKPSYPCSRTVQAAIIRPVLSVCPTLTTRERGKPSPLRR